MERLAFIISRVRVFIFLLLVFLWQTAESQRIVTGEYFFDSDPGLGNGTVFTVNSSGDSVSMNFDIPAGSLSCGVIICITALRIRQALGDIPPPALLMFSTLRVPIPNILCKVNISLIPTRDKETVLRLP
jgi:hypothetical protein